jgi:hypothetical protein
MHLVLSLFLAGLDASLPCRIYESDSGWDWGREDGSEEGALQMKKKVYGWLAIPKCFELFPL